MPFTIPEIYIGQVVSGDAVLTQGQVDINPAPMAQTPTYNPPLTRAPIPMEIPEKFKPTNPDVIVDVFPPYRPPTNPDVIVDVFPQPPVNPPVRPPVPPSVPLPSNCGQNDYATAMNLAMEKGKSIGLQDKSRNRIMLNQNNVAFLDQYKNCPWYAQAVSRYKTAYMQYNVGQSQPAPSEDEKRKREAEINRFKLATGERVIDKLPIF